MVVLGPYPLCAACREVNGGLLAARHPQVHVRAHGREACVDRGLAGLIVHLWAVCETRSCCEDENGAAYVVPTPDTRAAAEELLTRLGLRVTTRADILHFPVPAGFRLGDAEFVRRALAGGRRWSRWWRGGRRFRRQARRQPPQRGERRHERVVQLGEER
ncbi:hypothetical protein [Micromonospora sp. HK10]|uniref:hypothetical protein n=1 Tax=Micromonospora sp. HK10 TaxID=1538294 RepID=UPI0006273381|nr:hypothetical protein [Micromonospora sp. HK10]KKK06385.1 hypothetical protein LQ51_08430 [Micromonospora sp. HK10]